MKKESEFLDLIERLKVPAYLEEFTNNFNKTRRLKTVPEMLRKRLGLFDGKKWTYKQIGESMEPIVTVSAYKNQNAYLSPERVRQCVLRGYRIIRRGEAYIRAWTDPSSNRGVLLYNEEEN